MSFININVPGNPVGKQRARIVRSKAGFPIAYTPSKTVNYEALIKQIFIAKYPNFKPISGPVKILLNIHVQIPRSATKKRIKGMEEGFLRPLGRPDASNVLKIFEDALNGLAYRDDSQIVNISVLKIYSHYPDVYMQIDYEEER